jgi:hypothetical protein
MASLIIPAREWDIKLDSDAKMVDVVRHYLDSLSDTTSDVKTWDARSQIMDSISVTSGEETQLVLTKTCIFILKTRKPCTNDASIRDFYLLHRNVPRTAAMVTSFIQSCARAFSWRRNQCQRVCGWGRVGGGVAGCWFARPLEDQFR